MGYGLRVYDKAGQDLGVIAGQMLRVIKEGGPTTLAGGASFNVELLDSTNINSVILITSVPTIIGASLVSRTTNPRDKMVVSFTNRGTVSRTFTWKIYYARHPLYN